MKSLQRPLFSGRLVNTLPVRHFDDTRNIEMNKHAALGALGALAHEHRLALFRFLVQAGPEGRAAGAIAEKLALADSSLSFHLAHLRRAGLIEQTREGRSLIYSADFTAMNALVGFLTEKCCGGRDCAPAAVQKRGRKIAWAPA
jgi:DNA-binding transcriptional ArsR family regulator